MMENIFIFLWGKYWIPKIQTIFHNTSLNKPQKQRKHLFISYFFLFKESLFLFPVTLPRCINKNYSYCLLYSQRIN